MLENPTQERKRIVAEENKKQNMAQMEWSKSEPVDEGEYALAMQIFSRVRIEALALRRAFEQTNKTFASTLQDIRADNNRLMRQNEALSEQIDDLQKSNNRLSAQLAKAMGEKE